MDKPNYTICIGDLHLFGFNEKKPQLSKWTFDMQKYCISLVHNLFEEYNITKVVSLGDDLDSVENVNQELTLMDYFWSNIPKEVQRIKIDGNHELLKSSQKRLYYGELMRDFYKEKWNIDVLDFNEVKSPCNKFTDLYCSHKYIHKLQHLNKKYRYIFSHIRTSDGNAYYSDEINMTIPKACAKKIFLSDIHQHLEYDNIAYTGAMTWIHFPKLEEQENKLSSTPSVLLLNEETGEYKRIVLFNKESPYQKKLKHIKLEDLDNIDNIIEEMRQDNKDNKAFYKVRIYGKKFMIDKIKRAFKEHKDIDNFCIREFINLSMNDTDYQKINYNKLVKQCLDKKSVSKNLLEYIVKTNEDKRLEDKLVSTYTTLESQVEQKD